MRPVQTRCSDRANVWSPSSSGDALVYSLYLAVTPTQVTPNASYATFVEVSVHLIDS